ncbi:hypothetical protein D3C81_1167750 [compost metagenome]
MVIRNDISIDTLAFYWVRISDNSGFNNVSVHIDGIFNFCCTNAVARNVQYIIYTACNFIIAFWTTETPVACKIHILIRREIGLTTSVMIPPCRA